MQMGRGEECERELERVKQRLMEATQEGNQLERQLQSVAESEHRLRKQVTDMSCLEKVILKMVKGHMPYLKKVILEKGHVILNKGHT